MFFFLPSSGEVDARVSTPRRCRCRRVDVALRFRVTIDPDDDDGIDGADNANEDAMNAIAGAARVRRATLTRPSLRFIRSWSSPNPRLFL
jgi:hypothetical protein